LVKTLVVKVVLAAKGRRPTTNDVFIIGKRRIPVKPHALMRFATISLSSTA
jgi:hypothetical protein